VVGLVSKAVNRGSPLLGQVCQVSQVSREWPEWPNSHDWISWPVAPFTQLFTSARLALSAQEGCFDKHLVAGQLGGNEIQRGTGDDCESGALLKSDSGLCFGVNQEAAFFNLNLSISRGCFL
jgi:hypothetical protein